MPALVLVGEDDALTPPLAAKEIVAGLTGGRYGEIPTRAICARSSGRPSSTRRSSLFLHEVLA